MNNIDTEWDFDKESDEPVVWAAEWFGPEEKIEDQEEMSKIGVHIIYKGDKHFEWFYPQIRAAYDQNKIKEFVEFFGITDATEDDIKELTDFFYHWLGFVTFDIAYDQPPMYEFEDVNENLGDEDVSVIEKELEEAGMNRTHLAQEVKKTLH